MEWEKVWFGFLMAAVAAIIATGLLIAVWKILGG